MDSAYQNVGVRLAPCAAVAAVLLLASCASPARPKQPVPATVGESSADAARSLGHPVPALNFALPSNQSPDVQIETVNETAGDTANDSALASPERAVRAFATALAEDRFDDAWLLLSSKERTALGAPQRLIEQFRAMPWETIDSFSTIENSVTLSVTQTPRISEIDGVVARHANVIITTERNQAGNSLVHWSDRQVVQQFPVATETTDAKVRATVEEWIRHRQTCAADSIGELATGPVGVIGFAKALCGTTMVGRVTSIGDLDSLDEPQPVIEAFGGSALRWARVASVDRPVAMSVVLAPEDERWVVIGLAHPSLASQSLASQALASSRAPSTVMTTPSSTLPETSP